MAYDNKIHNACLGFSDGGWNKKAPETPKSGTLSFRIVALWNWDDTADMTAISIFLPTQVYTNRPLDNVMLNVSISVIRLKWANTGMLSN